MPSLLSHLNALASKRLREPGVPFRLIALGADVRLNPKVYECTNLIVQSVLHPLLGDQAYSEPLSHLMVIPEIYLKDSGLGGSKTIKPQRATI